MLKYGFHLPYDPLVVVGRQCNFVYFFREQLVPITSNDIHRPHLCLSRKQTRLVIFKLMLLLTTTFLTPLQRFSSFPSCILYAYSFARSPTNSLMIFPPASSLNILQPSCYIQLLYPRNVLWGNYSYQKIRAHRLKCPCKNLLFQSRMLNCRYL